MKSSFTLMTSVALLAIGLSTAQAADNTAPGGTGVVQSTEGQGATNKDTTTDTPKGAKSGSATGMQPGTGVEDSVQGEAATNKQGMTGQGGSNMGGASAGNATGGTGVETSSQGQGSQNKTSN